MKFIDRYGWTIIGYAGIASIGFGVYLIHYPSAFIVVGALLFGMALIGVLKRRG